PSKVFYKIGENVMLGLAYGLADTAPKVMAQMDAVSGDVIASGSELHSHHGHRGYRGGDDKSWKVDKVEINVHGVTDPNQARMVGEAAAGGFTDALARRQLQTTARLV